MNRRGYTQIEVFLVMLLLCAVSFLVFATVSASSRAYAGLSARQEREAALRVGFSFLDVKIRKNDWAGAVRVDANPFASGDALVIRSESEGHWFETWIYCLDGGLFELFTRAGTPLQHAAANRIAAIDRLSLESGTDGLLAVELACHPETERDEATSLAGVLYLKTGVA